MTRTHSVIVALFSTVILAMAGPSAQAPSAEQALRAAIEVETVKGDMEAAIEQYRVLAAGADRVVGAKALLRLARAYQRLGDPRSPSE